MRAFPLVFCFLLSSCTIIDFTPESFDLPEITRISGEITSFESCPFKEVFVRVSTETDDVFIPVDQDGKFSGVAEDLKNRGHIYCNEWKAFSYSVIMDYEFEYISENRFVCFNTSQNLQIELAITEPTLFSIQLFDDPNIDIERVLFDSEFIEAPVILKRGAPLMIYLNSNDRFLCKYRDATGPLDSWENNWITLKPCEDNVLMIPY